MSLDNRIFSIVVIYMLGFNKYWQRFFNLKEIKITPTLKQFLQSETLNGEKKKSYYQQYDVKILIALHKQAVIEQHIYKNILSRRIVIDYSPGMQFQKSIINMNKEVALTMNNQPGK